nr:MAG TPA: hypothetical protein [Caudoviricetes sp.]
MLFLYSFFQVLQRIKNNAFFTGTHLNKKLI